MSKLFNRNVIVQVGSSNSTAIEIPTTFKIDFNIQKMINSNSCQGSVTLYNLSDESKETIRDSGTRVRLYAGYSGSSDNVTTRELSLLHDGDVLRTLQHDAQVDRLTTLYLGAKIYTTSNVTFSKSYTGDKTIQDIISDAAKTFNLHYSNDAINELPTTVLSNFSFFGRSTDLMDKLLQPLNWQWFEDNGELVFSKVGNAVNNSNDDVIVLNSNSGLIKTAMQTDKGVNVVALLNPQVKAGSIVKIESDVIQNSAYNTYNVLSPSKNTEGYYKVIQITYSGTNRDGNFEMMLQCVPYGTSK